ncbi:MULTISPECIES: hypothetical protein [unclassified Variovorax]|uniref:hypothetical protein n=1 Tax=unclassified Variovorax TaxID=663243 RepID=UPI003F471143
MKYRFKQTLVVDGANFAFLTYDLQGECLVDELCDYASMAIDVLQWSRLTVKQELGSLRVFWAFLVSKGLALDELTDAVLTSFRDDALAAVLQSPAYRGSRHAAEATVNAKLLRVYDWLWWLQASLRVRGDLIGIGGASIRSASQVARPQHERRAYQHASKLHDRYPLLYRVRTARSKHSLPRTIPTEQTLDDVHAYFFSRSASSYLRHRNCLIADIASYTGFRRGSIQSLHVDQFGGEGAMLTDRDTVILKPARQKFGYGNTFEIPVFLHEQVCHFVQTYRSDVVARHGAAQDVHRGCVFLSARDAKPLTDGAMTALMSKAMRATGAVKGTALHAWRAKFAVEEVQHEYEHRAALGLDTSADTIERAVALRLGHKNSESMRAYTSWHEAGEVARRRSGHHREQLRARDRILELEKELAALTCASLKRSKI